MYQSTTSLGLGQVQMPRPKEVVATGAAARGSKKWYNFFYWNKVFVAYQVRAYSSSLVLVTSVFSHSNLVLICYRLGGYSNEQVRAFRPSTMTKSGNSDRTPFIQRRRRHSGGMAPHGFAEGLVGYTRWRKSIRSHADRGCPATKWHNIKFLVTPSIAQVSGHTGERSYELSTKPWSSWVSVIIDLFNECVCPAM